MLFSSYSFVVGFFPACLLLSLLVRRYTGLQYYILFLTAASLLFYAFGGVWHLLLMLGSIAINYIIAKRITGADKYKKLILGIGVFLNLLLLTYYKYTNFFIENYNHIADVSIFYSIVLPIGISFYTFQQIMYLVDTYRKKVAGHDFKTYVLYISFFPQLIAGPIVCHSDFFPQFNDKERFRKFSENIAIGLTFFAYGLFKKVAIADQLEAAFVNPVFDQSLKGEISFWEAWVGTTAYAFQIYYDFSGYSDMAVGLGKCFGIDLPQNFNSPYKSRSPREFWRRWHMTLSFFLRNYLYIPLGGNRVSPIRKNFNIIFTMFLAGLWHGAGWGFMVWGLLHGVGIAISHWLSDRALRLRGIFFRYWQIIPWAATFFFICICWVPFRGDTMRSVLEMWGAMFTLTEILNIKSSLYPETQVFILPLLLLHCLLCPNLYQIFKDYLTLVDKDALDEINPVVAKLFTWKPGFLWALGCASVFYISFLLMGTVNSFIYFQF